MLATIWSAGKSAFWRARVNALGYLAAVLSAAAALSVAGCGPAGEVGGLPEEVAATESELVTANGGFNYSQQCLNAGVPRPPVFGTTTIGSIWHPSSSDNVLHDSFVDMDGAVYYYTNAQGICVLLNHFESFFDVICQGTNGKACFWEEKNPPFETPNPFLRIAPTNPDETGIPGGTELVTHGSQPCTQCHTGQNVFIGHNVPNHPLNLLSKTGWMPSNNVYNDPIVPAGWPQPGPSTVNYPPSCTTCHKAGGVAGAFPRLDTSQFAGFQGGYCDVLQRITSIPGSQGGMPPSSVCDAAPEMGQPCANQTDPAVRKMLTACGAPNPPVPLSISGIDAPGIGRQFQAGRRHKSLNVRGEHEHFFFNSPVTMPNAGCCTGQSSHPVLKPADKIQVSVFLPADDPPVEVMVQVTNGSDWFRVYWGTPAIPWTAKFMGALPPTGSWQVLSFTPSDLGLPANSVLTGMAFTLYNGTAFWANALFRSSDPGFNGQFVSQVWVGDHTPLDATLGTDGGDFWTWQPENLAEGQTAEASSTAFGGNPEFGIDQRIDGNMTHGSVFHTSNTHDSTGLVPGPGGEWWLVNLGGLHTVRRVVLYNRTDCCMDRLSHFRINYWDSDQITWKVASDQSNTITSASNTIIPIDFPDITTGYIMVQKANNDFLHLAEVEVYGDR